MAGNNNTVANWYPPEAAQNHTTRIIFDNLYTLRDTVAAIPAPAPAPSFTEINQALSAGGSNPLNVNGLITEQQFLDVPKVSALPPQSNTYSENGFMVFYQGVLWRYNGNSWQQTGSVSLIDTHANRVANYGPNNYALGTKFFETDRHVSYIVKSANNNQEWGYSDGLMPVVPNNNNTALTLPADLGTYDDEFVATDSTFGHQFQWSGNNNTWGFLPGTVESGELGFFGPFLPNLNHWAAMNGANTTMVSGNGAISSYSTSNWTDNNTGAAFIQSIASGNYTGNFANATPPTWNNNAKTDTENAHTHNVNLAVSLVPVTASGNSNAVFPTSYTTGPGTAHSHNLSNNNAALNAPSEANNGLPKRLGLIIYIRR
jgi:hypothetical protein